MRRIRQIVSIVGVVIVLAASKVAAVSLEDQQLFASKIEALLDSGDYDYARAATLKYLEIDFDAAPVLRVLAHYYMKTTAQTTDDLIGHRYPDESAAQIIELLDRAVAITPDDHEALSLLVYTHALQGNIELGQLAAAKAATLETKAPWLGYNSALLAIADNRYADAVDFLAPIARYRPTSKNATATENIYRSAWIIWLRIALLNPELDPADAIRDGLVTRVDIKELPEYLHAYDPSGPPIILNLSSHDKRCGHCVKDMPVLYKFAEYSKENGSQYNIIHISIQPWSDAKSYKYILNSLGITGAPTYKLIHNGFHLKLSSDSKLKRPEILKNMVDNFDDVIANAKPIIKVLPRKDYQLDTIYSYIGKYKKNKSTGFRAYAYVIDDKFWASRSAYEHKTQDDADEAALKDCNEAIVEAKLKSICKIYARGKRIVDPEALARNAARKNELRRPIGKNTAKNAKTKTDNAALRAKQERNDQAAKSQSKKSLNNTAKNTSRKNTASQTTQGTTTTAANAVQQFAKIEEHFKALAIAQDTDASVSGTASREITQSRANHKALLHCNVAKQDFDITANCLLHTIGLKEITDQSEENIQKQTARQQKKNIKYSALKSSHRKYRKFSTDKAYAYSADDEGNWAYGMAFGKRGIEKATEEALEKCEEQRLDKNLADECSVLILNSKFVEQ